MSAAPTSGSILSALGFPPLSAIPTVYLCELHGIVDFGDRNSTSSSSFDSSLFSLLDFLSFYCSSSSLDSFCLSHEKYRSAVHYSKLSSYTEYALKYGFSDNERKVPDQRERGERFLQSRLDQLLALPSAVGRRVFGQFNKVYSPATFVDSSKSQAVTWREIVPGVNSLGAAFADSPDNPIEQWYFSYIGRPLNPAKNETLVRPIYGMPVNTDFPSQLDSVGYRFSFDFCELGFLFADSDKIEIRIFQLYRFDKTGDFTSAHSVKGIQSKVNRWIVEIRSIAAEEDLAKTQQKILKLAKAIEPIVKFTKAQPSDG